MSRALLKIAAVAALPFVGSGCAVVPLAASGAVALGVNRSTESAIDNNLDAQEMNCSQLRARYAELNSNSLQRINPFANQALKAGQVRAIGQAKGCRIP